MAERRPRRYWSNSRPRGRSVQRAKSSTRTSTISMRGIRCCTARSTAARSSSGSTVRARSERRRSRSALWSPTGSTSATTAAARSSTLPQTGTRSRSSIAAAERSAPTCATSIRSRRLCRQCLLLHDRPGTLLRCELQRERSNHWAQHAHQQLSRVRRSALAERDRPRDRAARLGGASASKSGKRVQFLRDSGEGGETFISPSRPHECYLAHPDDGLYRSSDGCRTFTGPTGRGIASLAFVPGTQHSSMRSPTPTSIRRSCP